MNLKNECGKWDVECDADRSGEREAEMPVPERDRYLAPRRGAGLLGVLDPRVVDHGAIVCYPIGICGAARTTAYP